MNEPRLEAIEDYDTLKGEKKRVVWAMVLAGFIIGAIYVVASSLLTNGDDAIQTQESLKNIPMK